ELPGEAREKPVKTAISGQFRMEGSRQNPLLADENRLTVPGREDFHRGADPPDSRRPDEDHRVGVPAQRGNSAARLERLTLPAITVALHIDVDEPERGLLGPADPSGYQDRPRARAEEGPSAPVELLEGGLEAKSGDEVQQRRA